MEAYPGTYGTAAFGRINYKKSNMCKFINLKFLNMCIKDGSKIFENVVKWKYKILESCFRRYRHNEKENI